MTDPLAFLKRIASSPPPPVVHLCGEDLWLQETVRRRIVVSWCGEGAGGQVDRLIGTPGIAALAGTMAGGSLFADKKVVALSDPPPGEKGPSLAQMGKNQAKALEEAILSMPDDLNRLIIETGTLKKTSILHKLLADRSEQVDVSPPKGAARRKWIEILAKRSEVALEPELLEAMSAGSAPLSALAADIEKLSLAVGEGEDATLEIWRDLSQTDPEATVWEIGDHLGARKPDRAMDSLHSLRREGHTIHDILPSLHTWSQQRLQIKSHETSGAPGAPEGVHPFVLKKITAQVSRRTLESLRREQRELLYLDRCSKQSWEDPEIALEKFLIEAALGQG